jgi:Tol biopolymer transport system component
MVLACTLTMGVVAVTTPAQAFPGTNGLIAFASDRTGIHQIYTMRVDGSHLRRLTNIEVGGAEFPNFSPDGTKIVFDNDFDGPNATYVMNADGSNLREVIGPGPLFDLTVLPAFDPSGSIIAFCAGPADGPADIWRVRLDGTDLQNLTNTPDSDECAPHFSPDGAWIAFDARIGDDPSAVYLIRPNGTGMHRVTPCALDAWYPNWSPDSSRLAFGTHFFTHHSSIWTIGVDGSGLTRLTNAPLGLDDGFPVYSPDGTQIAFTTDRGHDDRGDIVVMDVDGANLHNLTPHTKLVDDALPDWGVRP